MRLKLNLIWKISGLFTLCIFSGGAGWNFRSQIPIAFFSPENMSCNDLGNSIRGTGDQNLKIVKIYDEVEISRNASKVECEGNALMDDSKKRKIYYEISKDIEDEWLFQWFIECSPLEKVRFFSFSNDRICR